MRDSVVIKSDSGRNDKPYVAKIGSIWQEPGDLLLLKCMDSCSLASSAP